MSYKDILQQDISIVILANLSETSIKELMQLLKDKEFTSVRKWVGKNIDGDVAQCFVRYMIL